MLAQTLARPSRTVWNPLNKQYVEPDTTFLLDPDGDTAAGLKIGFGALLNAADASAPNIVAGKYRKGVQPSTGSNSYLWMPIDGVLPTNEFTIEQHVAADADWTTLTSQQWLIGENGIGNYVLFQINGSRVTVQIVHHQNAASLASYSPQAQSAAFSSGTYQAGVFHSIAVTLTKAGALTLYLDGSQAAQTTGVVAPTVWGQRSFQDGLTLPASVTGASATHLTISDLRVSRKARTPGVAAAKPTDQNTVVVSSTPSGATVQKLNGIIKFPTGGTAAPLATAAATAKAQAAFSVVRDDKYLSVTPIKAGATDATHPTAGQSGLYAYDWQVVDRSLDWIVNKLGAEPYISLTSVPQLLGGSNAPYSNTDFTLSATAQQPDTAGTITFTSSTAGQTTVGEFTAAIVGGGTNRYAYSGLSGSTLTGVTLLSGTAGATIAAGSTVHVGKLTGAFAYNSQFNNGVPNDWTAFAHMCADLAYHVRTELGYTQAVYWGLWNEPDAVFFGAGTITDYLTGYRAVVPAVKAVAAAVKMGGPEISNWEIAGRATWVQGLINDCASSGVALDFISFHSYFGNLVDIVHAQLQIAAWATAAGIATPQIIVGEWGWSSLNTGFSPGLGKYPWSQPNGGSNGNNIPPVPQTGRVDYAANDYNAAYHAAAMILMQSLGGYVRATAFSANDTSFFDASSVPQARYNVWRLWGMLGATVLNLTSTDLDPGMHVQASKDGAGKVYVLIANLHYRQLKPSFPVTVDVSALAVADGTAVTQYVVDDTHSNAYDTQGATSTLQTITVPTVTGGKVSTRVRPRSVTLLVIG